MSGKAQQLGAKRKRDDAGNDIEGEVAATSAAESEGGVFKKWDRNIHRCFVEAIFEAGVSQSSPSVIIENMTRRPSSLTSERVKSHLQKYRKNKQKSKDEFMQDYDSFMRKALTVGGASSNTVNMIMPPAAMMEMMGGGKPSGGDIAAFLSYSVLTGEEQNKSSDTTLSSLELKSQSQDYLKNFAGTHVPFPKLTEEEKRSPLGISMVYVMGLFSSLSQHMMNERRKNDQLRQPLNKNESVITSSISVGIAQKPSLDAAGDSTDNGTVYGRLSHAVVSTDEGRVAATNNVDWGNQSHNPQQNQLSRQHARTQVEGPSAGLNLSIIPKLDGKLPSQPTVHWNHNLQQSAGLHVTETIPDQHGKDGFRRATTLSMTSSQPTANANGARSGPDSFAQV